MEKINIAELLKDCPQGMELDCVMFENLEFDRIEECSVGYYIICRVKTEIGYNIHTFTQYGCYTANKYAKCVIFPKGKTTWEGFHRPFKDGDIVTWKDRGPLVACIYKERKNTVSFYHHIALYRGGLGIVVDGEIVLTDDKLSFATEEEKQELFQAIKENGYRWNNETKTLEKMNDLKFKIGDRITNGIVTGKIRSRDVDSYQLDNDVFVFFSALEEWKLDTSRFDITKLKPFKSEVLIRNDKTQKWIPAFWGYKADNGNYVTTFGTCRYCIPYEGNEHLLRTSNDCDDYYKIWEE